MKKQDKLILITISLIAVAGIIVMKQKKELFRPNATIAKDSNASKPIGGIIESFRNLGPNGGLLKPPMEDGSCPANSNLVIVNGQKKCESIIFS